ncbi:hypothetical protein BJV82DRAFT_624919 [Fennellomyces sp. T-0311]|nr:hypothetical protein BJV82DRAFT_624919 [Fennellomyces sp. T-0311]
MRLSELFWITPIIYGKPAYASRDYLYTELWSCMCRFPKHNKKKDDDAKPKEYVKNKKAYHLIMYLAYHLLVVDVIGSWFVTFTGNEVITLRQDRPLVFLQALVLAILALNSGFNIVGYSMQLFHCLYYDGGSYSDEKWHPLIQNPILSSSLQELWSLRWHQLFHTTWVAFGFRPTRYIMQRVMAKSPVKNPMPIIFIAASLAVFFFSGMTHEYMVYTEVGWSIYSRHFAGQELFFFFIHGLGMMLEQNIIAIGKKVLPESVRNSFFIRHVVGRLWVSVWAYYTFSYFINGFAYSAVWHDNPMKIVRPYVLQFLRSIPNSQAFCGSLL